MHPAGVVVIVVILALFAAAVALLCYVAARYKHLQDMIGEDAEENDFLSYTIREYAAAYKRFGQDVNTPGIIADAMGVRLTGLLFAERFLNNAVSLFVTLGLFGTFLGLSLSVTALTQLIRYSNTSEWLSVLDSVGGGLMSALAGMGVAFYTSLVGAGCSILLTVLRTVISPQARREQLATALELWLDHDVAPTLTTERAKDDGQLIHEMIRALDKASDSMEKTLKTGSAALQKTADGASAALRETMESSKPYLVAFHQTVEKFNTGVRDFGEVDYNLRGSVERLDVAVRDLTRALRQASSSASGESGR